MMAHIISDLFLLEHKRFGRKKVLIINYVIDNNEDYYIVKSVNSQKICDEIRKNNMDFTS